MLKVKKIPFPRQPPPKDRIRRPQDRNAARRPHHVAMRVHGHARGHALSVDSGHGRGFLPVADSGRGF